MGDGGQPGRALPQGTLLPLAQDQAVWTHPLIQRGKVPGADSQNETWIFLSVQWEAAE